MLLPNVSPIDNRILIDAKVPRISCADSSLLRRLVLCIAIIGLFSEVQGQEIPNGGFEEPSLEAMALSTATGKETRTVDGWNFGQNAGICLGGVEQAQGIKAAEGTQVAFIKGSPFNEMNSNVPMSVFGITLLDLEPGSEYEIEWVQAGSNTDEYFGAITTIVTDPENPASRIAQMNLVDVRGQWDKRSMKFKASAPQMRLFVSHSIPELLNGTATGDEVTLLDDFRIRKVD